MAKPIDECRRLLNLGTLTRGDFVSLFVNIRITLEAERLQSLFPILNVYCNWMFHPKLERSIVCLRMLDELTDHIGDAWNGYDDTFFPAVTETMGVRKLRLELASFLNGFALPDTVVRDEGVWKEAFTMIFSLVRERPIRFPPEKSLNKASRAIFDSVNAKRLGRLRGVKSVSLIVLERDTNIVGWEIELIAPPDHPSDSVRMRGQLAWP